MHKAMVLPSLLWGVVVLPSQDFSVAPAKAGAHGWEDALAGMGPAFAGATINKIALSYPITLPWGAVKGRYRSR